VALAIVLSSWGARHTWTAHREYAAQFIKAVKIHKAVAIFSTTIGGVRQRDGGCMSSHEADTSSGWNNAGGQGPAG